MARTARAQEPQEPQLLRADAEQFRDRSVGPSRSLGDSTAPGPQGNSNGSEDCRGHVQNMRESSGNPRRRSSVVEQRFRKPPVGSSSLPVGSVIRAIHRQETLVDSQSDSHDTASGFRQTSSCHGRGRACVLCRETASAAVGCERLGQSRARSRQTPAKVMSRMSMWCRLVVGAK
jgi:hypothetical protein